MAENEEERNLAAQPSTNGVNHNGHHNYDNDTDNMNFDISQLISGLRLMETTHSDNDTTEQLTEQFPSQLRCSVCKGDTTQNNDESNVACPVCFLLQQVDVTHVSNNIAASGSKRKHNNTTGHGNDNVAGASCSDLHAQMCQSQLLVEESAGWMSDAQTAMSKKAKKPAAACVVEDFVSAYDRVLTEDAMDIHGMAVAVQNGWCGVKDETTTEEARAGRNVRTEVESSVETMSLESDVLRDLDLLDVSDEETGEEQQQQTHTFTLLPAELKLKVFSYLTQRDLCRYVAPICSLWFRLSKDISLWQDVDISQDFEDVSNDLLGNFYFLS